MCGRYTLTAPGDEIAAHFGVARVDLEPRYNVAPTQEVPVVRLGEGGRELLTMRWGLVPSWADDLRMGSRLINARVESAARRPAFRDAVRARRCLVPASGFFEWKPVAKRVRQPYLMRRKDGGLLAFAGLWEVWRAPDGRLVPSFTILTGPANALVGRIHDRMPMMVRPEQYDAWLDPARSRPEALEPLPAEELEALPVSTAVNTATNEGPECIEPVTATGETRELFGE